MWKTRTRQHERRVGASVVVTVALAMAGMWVAAAGPWSSRVGAEQPEALRIDVTLDEYSFSPNPLRIPAGRPVTLVIRNVGRVPHEFMAGRDVADDDFEHDLFADLHVNIEPVGAGLEEHADHAAGVEHTDGTHHGAEHDQSAPAADHHAEAQTHAHSAGHEHGTMVEADAGETFLMTFTLPESRRGEWMTGCFLPGHYDAGMHGTVVVE